MPDQEDDRDRGYWYDLSKRALKELTHEDHTEDGIKALAGALRHANDDIQREMMDVPVNSL